MDDEHGHILIEQSYALIARVFELHIESTSLKSSKALIKLGDRTPAICQLALFGDRSVCPVQGQLMVKTERNSYRHIAQWFSR